MRERKRKLTEENVLQPFSFIIILFEKEKDFKQISSKGRDAWSSQRPHRFKLDYYCQNLSFLSVRFDALSEKRLQ
jgi:hypothetical protein